MSVDRREQMLEHPIPKVISATEASNHFGALVDEAATRNNFFLITRMGKARAVIMGIEQYRELLEALEISEEQKDAKFQSALEEAGRDIELGRILTLEELDRELGFTEEELGSAH
jgi:prevent-host-death family protein